MISKGRKLLEVFEYSELFPQLRTWYKHLESLYIVRNLQLIHSNRINHELHSEPTYLSLLGQLVFIQYTMDLHEVAGMLILCVEVWLYGFGYICVQELDKSLPDIQLNALRLSGETLLLLLLLLLAKQLAKQCGNALGSIHRSVCPSIYLSAMQWFICAGIIMQMRPISF